MEQQGEIYDSVRWPKSLVEITETLDVLFRSQKMSAPEARRLARLAVTRLAWLFGGRQVYLPKGEVLKRAFRDHDICRRLGPETAAALAEEYGLTEARIGQIAKREQALRRASRALPNVTGHADAT